MTLAVGFNGLTYIAGNTLVHRFDARVKIVVLFVYSMAIFFVQSWWEMGAFVFVALLAWGVSRLPLRSVLPPLVPVIVLAAFAAVFAFAASPGWDGLSAGLFVAVRMVVLVLASFIVCFTTASTDLLAAFSWLIAPLRVFHVPVRDISFTLTLALRFIPMVAEEFALVRQAQLVRGAALEGVSFCRKLSIWGAAFSALFVGLFRRADTLATAMDARCYGA